MERLNREQQSLHDRVAAVHHQLEACVAPVADHTWRRVGVVWGGGGGVQVVMEQNAEFQALLHDKQAALESERSHQAGLEAQLAQEQAKQQQIDVRVSSASSVHLAGVAAVV